MSARRTRHTRAHVRFHRDRVVAKRARRARELQWWFDGDWTLVEGRAGSQACAPATGVFLVQSQPATRIWPTSSSGCSRTP